MNILITGGAGFIGSHISEKYVKEGHNVYCLDNFMNGSLFNIRHLLMHRNFKLINGDVLDSNLLEKIMTNVDSVMHLAAQIHVDRSVVEPKLTYDINVLGTQNVLELARRHDVENIIHTSTSEVYGTAQYAPMDEKHPLDAPHPYGASKIAADRMAYAYHQTYGLPVKIVRPFNVFGPRQKDGGYGGVISIFIKRCLGGQPPLIYGDGKQTRDYTYVLDAVEAFDQILNSDKDFNGSPVNLGTGKEISIQDLAESIIKLTGRKGKLKPVHIAPRPGEVMRLVSNISRAKELFGYDPKYSFEDGLSKLVEWYTHYRGEEWVKPA